MGGACRWMSEREHQPRHGDGPQELVGRARCGAVHRRARLGQEVLDDHLLDVAVAPVAGCDRRQGLQAVGACLADADQQAGGEGDPGLPGGFEGAEPPGRGLVGRGAVGGQVRVERLDHHPLAGRDLAQPGQGLAVEGACVGMGQEAGLLQHRLARGRQVVDGRRVTVALEPSACHRIPILGSLPESEESLMATGGPAGTGDVQHFFDRQVGGVQPGRCLGEGAVAAPVAAQHGEGDEHLGREGDPVAVGRVTDTPGEVLQQGQRCAQQILIGPRRRRRGGGRRGGAGVGGHRRHLTGGVPAR